MVQNQWHPVLDRQALDCLPDDPFPLRSFELLVGRKGACAFPVGRIERILVQDLLHGAVEKVQPAVAPFALEMICDVVDGDPV
jgi:hypothetical protein